jgi:hypothetical protein
VVLVGHLGLAKRFPEGKRGRHWARTVECLKALLEAENLEGNGLCAKFSIRVGVNQAFAGFLCRKLRTTQE